MQRHQAGDDGGRGRTDDRNGLENSGQQGQQEGVVDAENGAKPDIGGYDRVDHDDEEADEISLQHRIEPPADLRDQGAPARRHQPEQPARHAFAADQEIAEQDDSQERADQGGKTEAGDEHEPVRPAEPIMDAIADGADDVVQVDRSSKQANRLAVGRAVQQMVKRSLQVGHRAAGLGDNVAAGYDNDESHEADQQQEQQDRQQRPRQPGSP